MNGNISAVWVTYAEVQELRPMLRSIATTGKYAQMRKDAKALLKELEIVRSAPEGIGFGATQVILTPRQKDQLQDLMTAMDL